MKNRQLNSAGPAPSLKSVIPQRNARNAAKMIESAAAKAGLDVARFNRLRVEDQKASRAAFDKERALAKKNFSSASTAFHSAMAARLKALGLLATPFTSTLVNLDKPFLIWQLPRPELNIFIDSHIEPMNNSVNVLVNTITGSDSTRFVFFFLWRNESDFFAVANVNSSLIVNGGCSVQAVPGIFSGDKATLSLASSLTLMRWSGWGTDPITGQNADQTPDPNFQQTQRQQISYLEVQGGHIFESAPFKSQSFSFQPFPLSHSLFVVPGQAVVVFEVALELYYAFDGGGDIQDSIIADFSSHGGSIICPNVELEILTPLPNATLALS
jgi:hypothetical protein